MTLFDEQSPSWDVVLKGDALKEFLVSSREALDNARESLSRAGGVELETMSRRIAAFEEPYQQIVKGLDGEGATKFGLSAGDMRKIIKRITQTDPARVDMVAHVGGIAEGADAVVDAISHEGDEFLIAHRLQALEENHERMVDDALAMSIQQVFCKCVAWQEKQNGNLAPWKEYFNAYRAHLESMLHKLKPFREQFREPGIRETIDIDEMLMSQAKMWLLSAQVYTEMSD